jgi:two-component system LytT family response regulator
VTGQGQSPSRWRALIVDDEPPARAVLREYLTAHQDMELTGECANGFDAVRSVGEGRPDLMFLDIQMPKLNGFEVLELLEHPPVVIFVTAFDEYALKAFEVHAVDYLLKPFSQERFDQALDHAREILMQHRPQPLAPLVESVHLHEVPRDRVLIRDGTRVDIIPASEIDFIEAQDDYVAIHSAGKRHLKQETLARLQESLDPRRFVRVHRSYLVNVDRLARIELRAKDARIVILKDGTRLPVSRSGYEMLKGLL